MLLLRGLSHVATFDREDRELSDADILIDGTTIASVGHGLPDTGVDQVIDGRGLVALPGLVNAHEHLYEAVLRCVPQLERVSVGQWLDGIGELGLRWWKAGQLDADAVGKVARAMLLESLLSGVTTVADQHYFFPGGEPGGYVEAIIEAAQDVGVRLHAARSSITLGADAGGHADQLFVEDVDDVVAHCVELIERYHDPAPFARIRVDVAPCGLHVDRPEMFTEALALADSYEGVRLHTHLYEKVDSQICRELYGTSPWKMLRRLGWDDERVWIAHGNDTPADEIPEFAAAGVGVAVMIAPDLKFGWGLAPVRAYLDEGVKVGFATTGPGGSNDGANLLGDLRLAALAHRLGIAEPDRWLSSRELLGMATRGSAACLGRPELGAIEEGYAADIACWDLRRVDRVGVHDPVAGLLMTGISDVASLVLVNGEVLVRDGAPTRLDAQHVTEAALSVTAALSASSGR